ncbi:leucine-rich repeat-containing protein 15-like [Battus philenor]|uniref:leucine-rich repeat-containing protein 15-like n=1 Tax=Battus philenor TaxID=42288 RepID=UPI0035CFE56C
MMVALLCTLLLNLLLLVETKPLCKSNNGLKDIGCTAGDSDYILKRGLISDNNVTTGITLKACRISEIELESFKGLPSLEYLDLSENKIKILKLGVLDGIKQVAYLNLSYNLLTEFPLGLFDQKPNLKLLDLRGNTLIFLKLGIFDALTKLEHLDLSSNSLVGREINPYIFDRSKQIKFIDFSRNDMSESPDNLLHAFRALDFLNLDRCFLKEVPRFATIPNLKNLKHLMISTNLISKIENAATFVNLDNLEILNLAENCLEYINGKSLKPLRNLKMIVLRDNKLKYIPDDLFINLPVLGNIDLSHNAITTIPVNIFIGTALRNLNLSDNKITYLSYNFCLELKNSGTKLSKFFFNQNPWQCACLRDILREVKNMNVLYNGVKYDGEHAVCVTEKEFICHRHENYNEIFVKLYDNMIA